jgi:hypothetical protein
MCLSHETAGCRFGGRGRRAPLCSGARLAAQGRAALSSHRREETGETDTRARTHTHTHTHTKPTCKRNTWRERSSLVKCAGLTVETRRSVNMHMSDMGRALRYRQAGLGEGRRRRPASLCCTDRLCKKPGGCGGERGGDERMAAHGWRRPTRPAASRLVHREEATPWGMQHGAAARALSGG